MKSWQGQGPSVCQVRPLLAAETWLLFYVDADLARSPPQPQASSTFNRRPNQDCTSISSTTSTRLSWRDHLYANMATAAPPQGPQQLSPQAIQQMIAMEAQKRGMTVPQFQAFQRQQIEQEAAKAGMTPQAFIQMKQEEARQQFAKQQQMQQQGGQVGQGQSPGQGQSRPPQGQPGQPGQPGQQVQHVPVNGTVEAKPEAIAVAKFLRAQNLKTRTCIFNGQRKDMFKGTPP